MVIINQSINHHHLPYHHYTFHHHHIHHHHNHFYFYQIIIFIIIFTIIFIIIIDFFDLQRGQEGDANYECRTAKRCMCALLCVSAREWHRYLCTRVTSREQRSSQWPAASRDLLGNKWEGTESEQCAWQGGGVGGDDWTGLCRQAGTQGSLGFFFWGWVSKKKNIKKKTLIKNYYYLLLYFVRVWFMTQKKKQNSAIVRLWWNVTMLDWPRSECGLESEGSD